MFFAPDFMAADFAAVLAAALAPRVTIASKTSVVVIGGKAGV